MLTAPVPRYQAGQLFTKLNKAGKIIDTDEKIGINGSFELRKSDLARAAGVELKKIQGERPELDPWPLLASPHSNFTIEDRRAGMISNVSAYGGNLGATAFKYPRGAYRKVAELMNSERSPDDKDKGSSSARGRGRGTPSGKGGRGAPSGRGGTRRTSGGNLQYQRAGAKKARLK